MITLGIDLASQAADTAACAIEWGDHRVVVSDPTLRCSDDDLCCLIDAADVIGIDAPFGWPTAFIETLSNWTHAAWDIDLRDRLRLRETDRAVCQRTGLRPLSVSTDRIALPAMRAVALLTRYGVVDRSGDGRFFEVYPAGSLRCWGFAHNGYKKQNASCNSRRQEIVNQLRRVLPSLPAPDVCSAVDHALDAFVASLTARAAALGYTIRPEAAQVETAIREGWIHLPDRGLPDSVAAEIES